MNALDKLESIAAEVVELSPNNGLSLSQLEQQFTELEQLLDDAGQPLAAQVSRRSAALLSHSKDSTGRDPAEILERVTQAVGDLQKALHRAEHDVPQSNAILESALASLNSDEPATSSTAIDIPPETSEVAAPPEAEDAPDPELVAGFISEAQEHLEAADGELLNIERDPSNQESLNAVFRAFHTIKGVAGFLGMVEINRLAHEAENLLDKARHGEILLTGAAMEAVLATVEAFKRLIAGLAAGEPGSAQRASVDRTIAVIKGALTGESVAAPAAQMPAANEAEASSSATVKSAAAEVLKVDRLRLDRLVDMIGELVIAESMIHRHLTELGTTVARDAAQLNKITRNLQQLSLSLRMIPLRGTFQKMARLVRDVAKKVNKPVEFESFGEDTELDKTVVDQIGDPLIHMIRNSVDHGIEPSSERINSGKPPHGKVTLRAFHRGGNIYIEIEDDGRGLDPQKLLKKARERGLVSEDAQLTEPEILNLIFAPGFSTAEKLTDVSGRGVGMDVVRRNVEALRGSVELRSKLGHGTCLTLRLPLTLAIIDGMVVRVGHQRYVIPTLSIVELLRPRTDEIMTVCELGEYFTVRNQQIALIRVGCLLEDQDARAQIGDGIVVLVEANGSVAGLLVDEVLGQQQAVIKNLGSRLDGQPGLSGGAIMPDGTVGLILDIHGLLQLHQAKS